MRTRSENSRYRQKRGDALAGNLEKKYGANVGVRSEWKQDALKRPADELPLTPLVKEQNKL
jgi:hypothetical protein